MTWVLQTSCMLWDIVRPSAVKACLPYFRVRGKKDRPCARRVPWVRNSMDLSPGQSQALAHALTCMDEGGCP
eukprot:scaffold207592_cov40-Tisochrysis_lutea.AAC.1